ncbi:MAG: ABC transporter ATP-binding protein [Gemmataceae bacterium]
MTSRSPSALNRFGRELRDLVRTAGRVWTMIAPQHRWALAGAVGVMCVGGAANTLLPLLSGRLVDRVAYGLQTGEPRADILASVAGLLVLVGGVILLREALQVVRRYLVENTCTRIERHLIVRIVSTILRADLSRLTHEKVGALHGRIYRSAGGFMRLLRLAFLDFFPAVVIGLTAVAVAVTKEPWLGLAMLGVVPCSVGLTVWQLLSQKAVRLRLMKVCEEMDGTVVEQLGGLDHVRAANTIPAEVARVDRAAEHKRAEELRHHIAMAGFGAAKACIEGLFHVGVLGLAAYLAVRGDISYGDILTFSMLYLSSMAPVNEIHRVLDEGHEASLRVADLQALLALPEDPSFRTTPADEPPMDDPHAPAVRAEGVRVEYRLPDGRTRAALNGVNLEIYRNETVGIAGRSGCGKTTWLRVLLRLVHPTAGRVWLNGVPLDEVSRETLSHLIGYVGQNPFVYAGTVADNIRYGMAYSCTDDDVRRAAERAGIHDDILAMPDGYATQVAERGANLSGGQKQRLALARVFLHNPPILVLDEATSALDTISERRVQAAIADARQDRTVILVAHRLSTFADADRILVFDDGRIVETGSYDELTARDGLFAELVRCAEQGVEGLRSPEPAADPVSAQGPLCGP